MWFCYNRHSDLSNTGYFNFHVGVSVPGCTGIVHAGLQAHQKRKRVIGDTVSYTSALNNVDKARVSLKSHAVIAIAAAVAFHEARHEGS